MTSKRTYLAIAVLIAAGLSALIPAMAQAETTTRVKIASVAHRENGCNSSYKSFKIVIPTAEKLDRDFKGVVNGIERVYTESNGTRGDIDWAFADDGAALTFQLFAKGGGTRIRNPFNGGSVCTKASGASIAMDIYAHYKL